MKTHHIVAAGLCLALAACGGISERNANWFDPALAKAHGPIDVTVVGIADAAQSAVADMVVASLRANGMQPGQTVPAGVPAPGYRLTIVYGPVAHAVVEDGQPDGYADACHTVNSDVNALLATAGAKPGHGRPLLALLCYQNQYQALAYTDLSRSASLQRVLPKVVHQIFAVTGANDG